MKTTRRAVAQRWLQDAPVDEVAQALHDLDPARLVSILQLLAMQKRDHARGVFERAGRTIEDPAQLIGRVLGAILR